MTMQLMLAGMKDCCVSSHFVSQYNMTVAIDARTKNLDAAQGDFFARVGLCHLSQLVTEKFLGRTHAGCGPPRRTYLPCSQLNMRLR